MSDPSQVTMAKETIHNPDEVRHFMKAKPVNRRVQVWQGDVLLAESTDALRVVEIGYDLYDPVLYLPREDVKVELARVEGKTTHCPLKGDAAYFQDGNGELAWSYESPFPFSDIIKNRIAFYPNRVEIRELPT